MLFTSKLTGPSQPEECGDSHYKCTNKKCIKDTWRCDGADQCGDKSDEEYCTSELLKEKLVTLLKDVQFNYVAYCFANSLATDRIH